MEQIQSHGVFDEISLQQAKQKLKQLDEQLHQPSHISIRQTETSFINKISVSISSRKYVLKNKRTKENCFSPEEAIIIFIFICHN